VPILGGTKYTDRLGRFSPARWAAVTAALTYDYYGTRATEPSVSTQWPRSDGSVLRELAIGLLYVGKDNDRVANHGVELDATLREGNFSGQVMLAVPSSATSVDYGPDRSRRL